MRSRSTRPSACRVSDSVDQTVGARYATNGGRGRWRGAGTAVWPPTVCTNVTEVPPSSTGCCRSGNPIAAKVMWRAPTASVVDPMKPPPE